MYTVDKLLKISETENLAENIPDDRLKNIGIECNEAFQNDLMTCAEKFEKFEKYIDIASQVIEAKSFPWEDAANVKFPLLTVAALQFNARAYPHLVPSVGVCKAIVYGEDPDGTKSEKAKRISQHMSYQVREEMNNWEQDVDQLLLLSPILGHLFKKTFYDPQYGCNKSVLVMPNKFVVNNNVSNYGNCKRSTEIITKTRLEFEQRENYGSWIKTGAKWVEAGNYSEEKDICEQHVYYDLYEDGNPLPYIITFTRDGGEILRITAGFDDSSIFVDFGGEIRSLQAILQEVADQNELIEINNQIAMKQAQEAEATKQVIQVPAIKPPQLGGKNPNYVKKVDYYVEYFYFPSFNGGFYKDGLCSLLESILGTIDTSINQMLDAGTLANLQGGLRAKVGKGESGVIGMSPGEFPQIETGGRPINDVISYFRFPGPSNVLFTLLGFLTKSAEDIASIKDIMVGEAPQGETATTTMIKQEEGMRVFTAIYKRMYNSMGKELKILFKLNQKHLTAKKYFRFGDSETYVSNKDYQSYNIDVIPTADPNESNMAQRLLKSQALFQFMGDPDADPIAIKKNYLKAAGFSEQEINTFFPGARPTQPGPEDIKLMVEVEKIKEEINNIKTDSALKQAKILEAIANAESKEVGTQIGVYNAVAKQLVENVEKKGAGGDGPAEQEGDRGMEGGPGNEEDISEAEGMAGGMDVTNYNES